MHKYHLLLFSGVEESQVSTFEKFSGGVVVGWGGVGGLFDYSVKPGPDLSRLRLSLVRLVTRSIKARFG